MASAALVLPGLGRWPLWQDEAFTWFITRDSAERVVQATAGDRHPPLYYLLVWLLQDMPDDDAWLRLPSALAVVAAVAVVGEAGRRWVSPRVGFLAASLLALSPYAVVYAHTARMYALLLLWGALLLAGALGLVRGRAIVGPALLILLAASGAIWTHYAGAVGIVGTGLAVLLGVLARPEAWRERLLRLAAAAVAFGLAGASFLPWATGPLQYQLSSKDAPAERTWAVLAYAWWAFDARVPLLSWAWAAAELAGVWIALRRRDWTLLGYVLAGLVLPWILSSSGPAQNQRNYSDLLPAAALLAAGALAALEARFRWPWPYLPAGLLLLAAEPLHDLVTRTVSPQETGTGFDYQVEAQVLDRSVPKNAALYFRPSYMAQQYARYAPGLSDREKLPVDEHTWLAAARAEFVESRVASRFPAECVFKSGFRVMVYAPAGPGCEAAIRWIEAVAEDREYGPFLVELARRALDAGDLDRAEALGRRAEAVVRGHPGPSILLTELLLRKGDVAGALAEADRALQVARSWRWAGATLGEIHDLRARAFDSTGDVARRNEARSAANCTRTAVFPSWCGTVAQRALPLFGFLAPPPPQVRPLPALSEAQDAAPPSEAPADALRVGLWALDGEVLPQDWVDGGGSVFMEETGEAVALGLASTGDAATAMACAPLADTTPRMAIRLRWRFSPEKEPNRSKLLVEARMTDAEGRMLQSGWTSLREELVKNVDPVKWRVDRYDFRPHARAAKVRICMLVDGPNPARAEIDWLEVLQVRE